MTNPAIFHITESAEEFTQLRSVSSDIPIHLTTSLALPPTLSEITNLVYLHIETGGESDENFKQTVCELTSLETLIIDRAIKWGFPMRSITS